MLALGMELALFLLVKARMESLNAGATTNPGPGSSTPSSIPSGTYLVVHLLFLLRVLFNRSLDDPCPHFISGHCDLVCLL